MAQVTEDQVLSALSRLQLPNGKSVVEMNMITGLVVKDNMVQFSLDIGNPENADKFEPMRKAAEDLVKKDVKGVLAVTAILTAEKPQEKAQQKPDTQEKNAGASKITHIVAVASGKGGVGKSTTAINLALALKKLGLNVGMLDADVFGPSQPRMLGVSGKPETSADGKMLDPKEGYGLKVMSMGFLVDEDQPVVWRGPMVMGALQQMLNDVNWGPLDVLIVDMPPGTGDAQLTMAQNVPLAGSVIISTPQDIALIDARKGLNMFRKTDVPVLGIIENMSYFLCPSCGDRSNIFGHGGAREEAEKLGIPFLGEIPLHMDIRETSDNGNPIVESDPESAHAKIYNDIASQLWTSLSGEPQNTGPKITIS
ncbi:Mrp/NBP35 family ATP-binding protein [Curvivirga sp.]|uniref:Mrp/NBP35 family ATP-binding protein n=1 Tax=Curvivirga sp. TaxID=2856848 RepID=UPI003B58D4FB